jgi:hypothetical protein
VSSFCGTRENLSPPMVPAWPLCENSHQLHQSEYKKDEEYSKLIACIYTS